MSLSPLQNNIIYLLITISSTIFIIYLKYLIIFISSLLSIILLFKFYARNKSQQKKIQSLERKLKDTRNVLITEVEERFLAERALKNSQVQLGIVWEKSIEGMRITDKDGIIIKVNNAFCNMVSKSREELEGNPFSIIYKKVNEDKIISKYKHRFETKSVEPFFEREFILWNDEHVWFEVSSSFLELKKDETLLLLIFRNITERKIIQQELIADSQALEKLNKKLAESEKSLSELNANKDKFFSILSHDLRSPFNSLLSISEFLSNDIETLSKNDIKKFSESIYLTTKNLYNLIDVLLQWSRLQTGKIDFHPEKLNLRLTATYVISLLAGSAIIKNIHIINSIDENIEIFADENMISSVLQNLISNSLKFTKPGGRIEVFADVLDDVMIEINVRDNGIGIDQSFLDKLFTFKGYSNPGTAMEKGTGLGLIICKEFVERNGGKIRAESTSEGTTFIFTVRLASSKVKLQLT